MSSQSRYYDMPGNIKVKNGIVHIDMYDEAPDPKAQPNDNPNFVFSERLAMSVPCFVELYRLMSQAVDNLVSQGVLSRDDEDKAEEEGTAETASGPVEGQSAPAAEAAPMEDSPAGTEPEDAGAAAPQAASSRRNSRRKKNKRR